MAKFGEGGARAGAGRKGFEREQMVKKILNSADKVVYETLNRIGRYREIEDSVVIELAARIHVKAMPQKLEGDLVSNVINIIRPNDGRTTKELPGRLRVHRSPVSGNGVSLGNGKEPLRNPKGS